MRVLSLTRYFSSPGRTVPFLILLWGAFILLPFLGTPAVFQVSEGREGVVIDEILSSGEWILPRRNGEIVPSKPILFHWVGALTGFVRGEVDEFTLRFPSALTALLFLTYFSRVMVIRVHVLAGVIAPLLLLSTYGYVRLAQDGRVDMVFAALSASSVLVWLAHASECLRRGAPLTALGRKTYLLVAVLSGFAVLAKGPLGIILPAVVIVSILAWFHGVRSIRYAIRPEWIAALLIPLPWYLAASVLGSEGFIGRQLIFENVSRFVGAEGISAKSPSFYALHLFTQGAPWTVLFVVYLGLLAYSEFKKVRGQSDTNRFLPSDSNYRFWIVSGLIWIFSLLLLFTVSSGKRRGYLLPLLPAVALVLTVRIVASWERLVREGKQNRIFALLRYEVFTWGVLCWLVALLIPGALFWFSESSGRVVLQAYPELRLFLDSIAPALALAHGWIEPVFLLLAGAVLTLWIAGFYRRSPAAAGLAIVGFVQWVLFIVWIFHAQVKGITHSFKDYAQQVRETVPLDLRLNVVKTRTDEHLDGFFFYFKRHVTLIDPKLGASEPGVYFARQSWVDAQTLTFRERTKVLGVGGRRTDAPSERWVLFTFDGLSGGPRDDRPEGLMRF
jgi:4-amino-4-deoxy-L-arabinose transferase-like glycosyltransferase